MNNCANSNFGYNPPVTSSKGVAGVDSPNEAVMNRTACKSYGGFFTSDAPITAARTREPHGSPVPHRSINLVRAVTPFDSGLTVLQNRTEANHHD